MKIVHLNQVNSTNSYVRELNEEMTLVYADYQTDGRGQRGNCWESEQGKNLLFSFLLKPTFLLAEKQFELSMLVSVALAQTLDYFGVQAQIKWPNDIYIGDKKICGILIENDVSSSGVLSRSVVGIGVNINQSHFYSDAPNPTSLLLERGCETDIEEVLTVFGTRFEESYRCFASGERCDFAENYLRLMYRRDKKALYSDVNGEFVGIVRGTGEYGMLQVEKADGVVQLYQFKEITYYY